MQRVVLVLVAMALALLLASGVAWAVNRIGTDGPDTLRGTNNADNLLGVGGQDYIFGLAGEDNLWGGEDKDWVLGGDESDSFEGDKNLLGAPSNDGVWGGLDSDNAVGGAGNDFVNGDKGSDRIVGDRGNDLLTDGFPDKEFWHDNFYAGAGNDVISANHIPSFKDKVVCGGGFDRVAADTKDVVAADCERVDIIRTAAQDDAFFQPFRKNTSKICWHPTPSYSSGDQAPVFRRGRE